MKNCKLDSLRGYSYKLPNSIINCPHFHKGGILMPLANSLQFYDGEKSKSLFQSKRQIAAVQLKGNLVSIGQKASPGQLISAVLFDLYDLSNPKIFNYQKTNINFIAASINGKFFCTVGSSSESSQQLSIIQTQNQSQVGTKIFYSKTFEKESNKIRALKFSNNNPHLFVLLRAHLIVFYKIDEQNGIVNHLIVKSSKVRQFNNIIFSPNDQFLYTCSRNGDISEISVKQNKEVRIGPRKRVITKGITNIRYLLPNSLVITGKQGFLGLIELKDMNLVKEIKLQNEIVCFSEFHENIAYITTTKADIYRFNALTFEMQLIYTSHSTKITSLALLKDFSDIFGTAAGGQIVIWNTKTLAPIIKIQLPKIICESLHFPKTAKYIVSGWNDDNIRIFSPKNGKLLHTISNCGLDTITSIISDDDTTEIICGGQNGVIRIWNLLQTKIFGLIQGSLAFHCKRIHSLMINQFNANQMVSSCQDGSYGIWNLSQFQLQKSIQMTNFIKEIHFENEFTLRIIGSGNSIIDCNINDGKIINTVQVSGSNLNSICSFTIEQSKEKVVFYAGNSNHIYYFDTLTPNKQTSLESFGEVNKLQLTSDQNYLLAVTQNGVILKYSIFAAKFQMKILEKMFSKS